jgi:unsaturated chondroitin disaccharide hydrolase
MDKNVISQRMQFVVDKVDENMGTFRDTFPTPQSEQYQYGEIPCNCWTSGFFVGMELLAYEHTKEEKFLKAAEHHLEILRYRIDHKIEVDHHDMGFLYSLSAVADYKITGSEYAKETAVLAADQLLTRFNERAGFIQAWGAMGSQDANRLIIDCLMNIPLLFWATEVTGNEKYARVAKRHLYTTVDVIIRENATTHHTYYFDVETGKPLYGRTAQGASDDSCWARGQAWGIYGMALAYRYTGDERMLKHFYDLTDKFMELLPEDGVPYWDMIFGDGSDEPRDTSAAAIAVCGILEMNRHADCLKYLTIAEHIMDSLAEKYTSARLENSNVVLTDGMYARPFGHKPEGTIFGDYFYMEALMRELRPEWKIYW